MSDNRSLEAQGFTCLLRLISFCFLQVDYSRKIGALSGSAQALQHRVTLNQNPGAITKLFPMEQDRRHSLLTLSNDRGIRES